MSRPKGSANARKVIEPIIEPEIKESVEPIIETIAEKAPGVPDVKPEARREFWEVVKWKGVKNVFKCKNCGHCEGTKDEIILHVVTHFPKSEQSKQFEKLMKEY